MIARAVQHSVESLLKSKPSWIQSSCGRVSWLVHPAWQNVHSDQPAKTCYSPWSCSFRGRVVTWRGVARRLGRPAVDGENL